MADRPDTYPSSFGGLRLWLSRITTERPRSQIRHELSDGDDHIVQDKGQGLLIARCSVIFEHMLGDDIEPIERLRRLRALVDDKPRILSHPIEGNFLARVGPFDYTLESNGTITAELEFAAVSEVQTVSSAGAGGIPASGSGSVTAAAEAVNLELADVEMSSPVPSLAASTVDGWASSDDLNPRDVYTQTGSLTSSLSELAAQLETDLVLWNAYRAVVVLQEAVRAAAETFTTDVARTFVVRIGSPIALNALLTSIYGADEIDLRRSQALKLNDIPNPAWLEPGLDLVLPAARPTARNG